MSWVTERSRAYRLYYRLDGSPSMRRLSKFTARGGRVQASVLAEVRVESHLMERLGKRYMKGERRRARRRRLRRCGSCRRLDRGCRSYRKSDRADRRCSGGPSIRRAPEADRDDRLAR